MKSKRFAGDSKVYKSLEEKEKQLKEALLLKTKNKEQTVFPTWRDVKQSLHHDEYAIEFITYSLVHLSISNMSSNVALFILL